MSEVSMDRMSWRDYERHVKDAGAVVLLPVGATEQHGPHLPLGADALLATAVAQDVARRVEGIVAPTFSYGYKSQPKCGGGNYFCGTTSLDAATLAAQVKDVVREFARHGVKHLVIVRGHTFSNVAGVKKSQYSKRIMVSAEAKLNSRMARSMPSIKNHWFS